MKRFFYIAALFTMFCSCTKEIELDYNDIEPLPVIEGLLSPDGAEVKITQTRNMDDSVKTPGIRVESVIITGDDGTSATLDYQADGIYRPATALTLADGTTYTLAVRINGVTYTGSSTLKPTVHITEPEFVWANLMDWMQVLEFETTDIPDDEEVFGWARIHRNGEIYFSDAGKCTGNSPFDIGLYYDSDMEDDEDVILYDGDVLRLEFRTIDERVYDYLSEYNATKRNPEQFFTPSQEGKICLGYFAAYNSVAYEMVYKKTPHE